MRSEVKGILIKKDRSQKAYPSSKVSVVRKRKNRNDNIVIDKGIVSYRRAEDCQ